MTITATGAVVPPPEPSLSTRRSATTDSGFSVPGSGAMVAGQAEASCARETSPVIDAGAILALQEHAGQDAGPAADLADREARRHGQNLLEALAALQKELLAGGDPVLSLSRLSALAGMTMAAHDPALAHILASIRLRARLEILRLARGSVPAEPGSWPAGMARTVKGS